ncbi:hypothetical protein DRE_01548 [Drechslerella stenobrocha 248]|uniref:Uncharacterized protein n=1 Tax=Drechslerella stenobrocha 248 TaxID=1043628 RepID=W7HIF6_9PEZI|nr:hypothetical protein DRE_01548 [Drechslerella stenobrocha 248]
MSDSKANQLRKENEERARQTKLKLQDTDDQEGAKIAASTQRANTTSQEFKASFKSFTDRCDAYGKQLDKIPQQIANAVTTAHAALQSLKTVAAALAGDFDAKIAAGLLVDVAVKDPGFEKLAADVKAAIRERENVVAELRNALGVFQQTEDKADESFALLTSIHAELEEMESLQVPELNKGLQDFAIDMQVELDGFKIDVEAKKTVLLGVQVELQA